MRSFLVSSILGFGLVYLASQCLTTHAALNACRNNYRVVTTVLIYENPVYINTEVLSNTTFEVNPGLTVTVDNAPTSFDITTTYTSKLSSVDTAYASPVLPTSFSRGTLFTLLVAGLRKSHFRRQSSGGTYLGFNGTLTSSCSSASTYTLSNGQLYEQVNGATLEFSAANGIGYEYFIPSSVPAAITTSFSLGEGGLLQWINPDFFNGNALFCAFSNGSIIAVFSQDAEPSGCDFIDITIGDISSCVAQAGPSDQDRRVLQECQVLLARKYSVPNTHSHSLTFAVPAPRGPKVFLE
ncbi:hypothetical protein MMC18_005187 [Xylographa bjoerkii]|nr:hypothetical protein [Xylographa bjoerkii]